MIVERLTPRPGIREHNRHIEDKRTAQCFVAYSGDCVAKLFLGSERAILIQVHVKARNIDSKHHAAGFDNCAFQRSEEFCNTIGARADIGRPWF
jgi:hypothetical protein